MISLIDSKRLRKEARWHFRCPFKLFDSVWFGLWRRYESKYLQIGHKSSWLCSRRLLRMTWFSVDFVIYWIYSASDFKPAAKERVIMSSIIFAVCSDKICGFKKYEKQAKKCKGDLAKRLDKRFSNPIHIIRSNCRKNAHCVYFEWCLNTFYFYFLAKRLIVYKNKHEKRNQTIKVMKGPLCSGSRSTN